MTDNSLTLELHNRAQAWAVIKDQVYPFLARWLQGEAARLADLLK